MKPESHGQPGQSTAVPTMQPLGNQSCWRAPASPPLAHLLPLTLSAPLPGTAPSLHLGMPPLQRPLSHRKPNSSQAPGRAPSPPNLLLLQRHRLSPFPNKMARGGSGGHNPVKPSSSPKMAPPFPLDGTEASLGCPCPSLTPKCIWAQKAREVEAREPGVGRDISPALNTLPSHQQRSSPAHHADPGKGGTAAAPWRTQIPGHLTSSPPQAGWCPRVNSWHHGKNCGLRVALLTLGPAPGMVEGKIWGESRHWLQAITPAL